MWTLQLLLKVTPRSHNRDPQFQLLLEEWNPVQKKPQQILVFCMFGALCAAGPAGALSMPQSYIKETEHIRSVIFTEKFILLNDLVQL
jgi:hypothetical protein